MIQFKPYPIFINFNEDWQDYIERKIDAAYAEGDGQMVMWWLTGGSDRMELMPDATSAVSRHFENEVAGYLRKIASSSVGKLVLNQLKREKAYWVLPLTQKGFNECQCLAHAVGEHSKQQGGGYRIHYGLRFIDADSRDDVLLHELVHAYRQTYFRRVSSMVTSDEIPNGEEFFAYLVQNMYRSELGKKVKYVYSRNPHSKLNERGSFQDVYRFFTEEPAIIQALEYFYNIDEPLCKVLAGLTNIKFNPWRDLQTLKRIANDKSMLNFGVPLSKLTPYHLPPLMEP